MVSCGVKCYGVMNFLSDDLVITDSIYAVFQH